jgi:hypothetical protein
MFDDDFDAFEDEPDTDLEPDSEPVDFEALDPEDDDEAEPAPGDFWFENDDAGDE